MKCEVLTASCTLEIYFTRLQAETLEHSLVVEEKFLQTLKFLTSSLHSAV